MRGSLDRAIVSFPMVRRELRGPRRSGSPSLRAELDHLAPAFRAATRAAAKAYERAGVRYALIGGVAAGAYSQPRATKDVDFLVGDEAFDSIGTIVSFRPGIPLEAHGVPIDSIPLSVEYRELYELVLSSAVEDDDESVRIALPGMVAVTKLVGGRHRDITAVAEMLHAETVNLRDLERTVAPYEKLRTALARAFHEYEQED